MSIDNPTHVLDEHGVHLEQGIRNCDPPRRERCCGRLPGDNAR